MRQAAQVPGNARETCALRSRRRHKVPIIMVYDRKGQFIDWEFPYDSAKVSEELYDKVLRP
jgi:hypothetical protein